MESMSKPAGPGKRSVAVRAAVLVAALLLAPACKQEPAVGPAKGDFALTAPSNGSIGVSATPTFTWEESFSVETPTYTIQVSIDPGFVTLIINQSGLTTTSFTPGAALSAGTVYYWQVLAVRSSGSVVSMDAPSSFTTFSATPGPFTMIAPANLAMAVPITTSFSWNPSAGAASYNLQVATDLAFTALVVDQTGLTTTSFTPASPLTASTVYFWKVTAVSTVSVLATGAPSTFTTASAAPGNTVTLTTPLDLATGVSLTPTFNWSFTGTTPASYVLQISTDSGFGTFVVNQGSISTTSFTLTTPLASSPTNPYFWRVESLDSSSAILATSSTFSFKTN
jgi:hypothetical protein